MPKDDEKRNKKTSFLSQHRIPTSSSKAAFNADVFTQIKKMENESLRELAMQQAGELPILLDNTILKHLNNDPTLAATLLAQSKEYIDSFWPKSPPEQMQELQSLQEKIKLVRERPRAKKFE